MIKKHPTIFMGLGVTILFLLLCLLRVDFLETMELKFYDLMMKLKSDAEPSKEIVLVDIDDDSIDKLGRWPWPRSLLALGINKINEGKPKVIGLNIILSEPEKSEGLKELIRLKTLFKDKVLDQTDSTDIMFFESMNRAQEKLDHDNKLVQALKKSGKVVLPVYLILGKGGGVSTAETNENLIDFSIQNIRSPLGAEYPSAKQMTLPILKFLPHAKGIGHINIVFDSDGTIRKELPIIEYQNIYIPSYAIQLASKYLGLSIENIHVDLGSSVTLGSLKIPTTKQSEFLVSFKESSEAYKNYSYQESSKIFKNYPFFDVINDKIDKKVFYNKLVLVSPTAAGIQNPLSTPTNPAMNIGEFSANVLSGILDGSFIQQPIWNEAAEYIMILILGLIITFLLPRLKALVAGIAFLVLISMILGSVSYFFISKGLWIRATYPLFLLIIGYIGVISLSFFITETKKEKVEGESAESNRMLGLSFQSQGMLDMAFDKLRKVPVDDEMKDILYNLGLDYERKRQINKAARVYEYIEQHDKNFKDVGVKKKKLLKASETMVFGDDILKRPSTEEDLISTATTTRPTLGRYEVIKQLGKGAMGIVYLGKDPRINRTTAIKTFRFDEDFDPEAVEELKVKFFREAESAGTLSHPNIVTIYDAGDEHDLAYIAMEFLEGEDLEKYTKKDELLPMLKVLEYTADVADALEYAHQKGIVHRDIKPANIMLLKSGVIKITDFGIARITATSQTQTGVVKGTPYYMSPEQFSGKKVDGRSDIFSLGTMFFQLLTGVLPFMGETPAALMHQIMNAPHPDPQKINPKIVKPITQIIDRALDKDREKRYQQASLMAKHLREVHRKMQDVLAKSTG